MKATNSSRFRLAALAAALALPAPRARAQLLAVSPDGHWAAASNPDSGTVTLVDARGLKTRAQTRVGRKPQGLAFTEDSRLLLVANELSHDLSWVDAAKGVEVARTPLGGAPLAVAVGAGRAYVVLRDKGAVAAVDLAARAIAASADVGPSPSAAAFVPGGPRRGALLLVAHLASGRISVLDAASLSPRAPIELGPDVGLVTSLSVSRDGARAFAPHTRALAGNRALSFDTTVMPAIAVVDLAALTPSGRLTFDNPALPAVNIPASAAASRDGRLIFCANAGTDNVAVLDAQSGRELAHLPVGANPRGLAVSPDGARLFVNNALDGTLTVFELAALTDPATLFAEPLGWHPDAGRDPRLAASRPLLSDGTRAVSCAACHIDVPNVRGRWAVMRPGGATYAVSHPRRDPPSWEKARALIAADGAAWDLPRRDPRPRPAGRPITLELTRIPLDARALRGKRLFNAAAPRDMSAEGWISCATCHWDGGSDGRTWEGFRDGPRNTPALHDLARTLPLHWSGDLASLHDVDRTIRRVQFGRGLDSTGLEDLASYLRGLETPPSPFAAEPAAAAGLSVFRAMRCDGCHAGPLYTDGKSHDVGTGDPRREKNERGRSFDTPSLLGAWATAPYFHDGSAATLDDVLKSGAEHGVAARLTDRQRADLTAFILSLGAPPTAPGQASP